MKITLTNHILVKIIMSCWILILELNNGNSTIRNKKQCTASGDQLLDLSVVCVCVDSPADRL